MDCIFLRTPAESDYVQELWAYTAQNPAMGEEAVGIEYLILRWPFLLLQWPQSGQKTSNPDREFPRRGSWWYRPSGIRVTAVTPYICQSSWRDTETPEVSSRNTARSTKTVDRVYYSAGRRSRTIKSRRVLEGFVSAYPGGLGKMGMPDRDDITIAGCFSLPRESVGARRSASLGYHQVRVSFECLVAVRGGRASPGNHVEVAREGGLEHSPHLVRIPPRGNPLSGRYCPGCSALVQSL
jgi:hypothetical protein